VLDFTWVSNHGTIKAIQGCREKGVPKLATKPINAINGEGSNLALFQGTGKWNLRIEKQYGSS